MGFVHTFFETLERVICDPINDAPPLAHAHALRVTPDVVYDGRDPDVCRYDVHTLPSRAPRPLLLYFHGGGFVAGDKSHRTGVARWYAGQGYCVLNCNYGLCPTYRHPYPLRQLTVALNHAVAHARDYGADPDRIVLAGDSAGAYLAAMLAAVTVRKDLQDVIGEHTQAQITATVLNCGMYDVESLLRQGSPFSLNERICQCFAGCDAAAVGEYAYLPYCSPRKLITPDFAPTFVLYAAHDVFCKGQGEALVAALREQGVRVSTYGARSVRDNHCFSLCWSSPSAKLANARIKAFLREVCPS